MSQIQFPGDVAFYIGNVCNLSCSNCITLSNYNFKGWFPWSEKSSYYEQWSKQVYFPEISLLGGEPFLNKELLIWATNVKQLWPDSNLLVETNGTLLGSKNIDLSLSLLKLGFMIRVSCHSADSYDNIENTILEILRVSGYDFETMHCEEREMQVKKFLNKDRVFFDLIKCFSFSPPPIDRAEAGKLYFKLGNEKTNHDNCMFNDCYTMVHGLLYKCQFTATYSVANKVFVYEDQNVRNILDSYRPCSPYDNLSDIQHFIDTLSNSITPCKACTYSSKASVETLQPIVLDKNFKKFLAKS
jgi:hypothetical protein